jgi:hypothetical protein
LLRFVASPHEAVKAYAGSMKALTSLRCVSLAPGRALGTDPDGVESTMILSSQKAMGIPRTTQWCGLVYQPEGAGSMPFTIRNRYFA